MTTDEMVDEILKSGERFARAVTEELALEDEKPLRKADAIRSIIGSENVETGKPHSASSAEKVVEAHPEYAAFLTDRRAATYEKIVAGARYAAAKARARMAAGMAEVLA